MSPRALALVVGTAAVACGGSGSTSFERLHATASSSRGVALPAASAPAVYRAPPNASIAYRISFEDHMTDTFYFKRLDAKLDGQPLALPPDTADHVNNRDRVIIDVKLTPGQHVLSSLIEYQGNGYGSSSYLKGYKFEIRSIRKFVARERGELVIVGYEQGGKDGPIEERPAVRYEERTYSP